MLLHVNARLRLYLSGQRPGRSKPYPFWIDQKRRRCTDEAALAVTWPILKTVYRIQGTQQHTSHPRFWNGMLLDAFGLWYCMLWLR